MELYYSFFIIHLEKTSIWIILGTADFQQEREINFVGKETNSHL